MPAVSRTLILPDLAWPQADPGPLDPWPAFPKMMPSLELQLLMNLMAPKAGFLAEGFLYSLDTGPGLPVHCPVVISAGPRAHCIPTGMCP